MENPMKMDDLGVPLFLETPIYMYHNFKPNVGKYTLSTIHGAYGYEQGS